MTDDAKLEHEDGREGNPAAVSLPTSTHTCWFPQMVGPIIHSEPGVEVWRTVPAERCMLCGVLRHDLRPRAGATLWAPQ